MRLISSSKGFPAIEDAHLAWELVPLKLTENSESSDIVHYGQVRNQCILAHHLIFVAGFTFAFRSFQPFIELRDNTYLF